MASTSVEKKHENENNSLSPATNFYGYDFSDKYYYNQLSPGQKTKFSYIYDGVVKYESSIVLENLSVDDFNKMVYILHFDCPELFYLSEDSQSYKRDGNKALIYYPQYTYSYETVQKMKQEISEISDKLKLEMKSYTPEQKEKFIHDYLIENTTYTLSASNKGNIYGCLIENKANCKGYSSSFSYLCRLVGLKASQVIGTANTLHGTQNTIGHSWNFVTLNETSYYVDVCWDDFDESPDLGGLEKSYIFYNLPADTMFLSHNPTETNINLGEIPLDKDDSQIYYKKEKYYVASMKEAYDTLKTQLKAVDQGKEKYVIIQCSNYITYDELQQDLMNMIKDIININKLNIDACNKIDLTNDNTLLLVGFSSSPEKTEKDDLLCEITQ